jgi:hypothetical protein
MLPARIEHRFQIDAASYCLTEWDRGGDKRIKIDYALSLIAAADSAGALPSPVSAQPDFQAYAERLSSMSRHLSSLIEVLDGDNLWVEAIARECLTEAPDIFWDAPAPASGANGMSTKRVKLDTIPRALWHQFRREVLVFRDQIFRQEQAESLAADTGRAADQGGVAPAEAVPPVFRGRAE